MEFKLFLPQFLAPTRHTLKEGRRTGIPGSIALAIDSPDYQSSIELAGSTKRMSAATAHRRCEMKTLKGAAFAGWSVIAILLFSALGSASNCTVTLTPSKPSPQFVGELVVWTTTAANCGDVPVYQYKVAFTSVNPQFRITRDFGLANTLSWGHLQ